MLIDRHGGLANLCEAIGLERTATAGLARIANANVRHERGGQVYNMGSPQARDIEAKLGLPVGWMDTPPTYAELHGTEDPVSKGLEVLQAMEPEMQPIALRLLVALVEQHIVANGTTG